MPGSQEAANRSTEAGNHVSQVARQEKGKAVQAVRRGGRPKGSKSKPKGILPTEVAKELLGIIRPLLPVKEYEEIQAAIKEGKSISTLKEMKIMMALMGPPIWKRLIEENKAPDSDLDPELEDELGGSPELREFQRDTSERLKIFKDLGLAIHKMELDIESGTDNSKKPVFEVYTRSGVDAGRFAVYVDSQQRGMGGNGSGLGGPEDSFGAIPSELPERPERPEDSEQIETIRILDTYSNRDDTLSDNEEEL